ncbi:Uncharacterised protein [Acinetobacter baumannii]|uniref:hypothetical protein n=1 Tax=Providencia stuartii TaxID=588 RepID=UPI000DE77522|nr:hypothetical protein [Providencia stuartii]MDQ5989799.1 hypothetical protein [Providencia stuartii]SST02787.1 Uncharacterised protein [Acinetobacter baumannii]
MNTLILAIALISGYVYVINAVSERYKFKRSEGWDAYFYIAVWGVFFTVIAWILCSLLSVLDVLRITYNYLLSKQIIDIETINRVFPLSQISKPAEPSNALADLRQQSYYMKLADLKFALFGVVSILLSWITGKIVKWYVNKNVKRRIDALVKVVHNDPFESLLIEADVRRFPVIITLSSRKIYVGLVSCPQFEHGRIEYIEILPLLSGYRDKDELTVKITTNYRKHYSESGILSGLGESQLSLDDFRTLIPKSDIEGISFFDTTAYSKFKEDEEKDKEECNSLSEEFMPKSEKK